MASSHSLQPSKQWRTSSPAAPKARSSSRSSQPDSTFELQEKSTKSKDSVVLVTCANHGIGLPFTRELLARGARKVYAGACDPSSVTEPGVQPLKLNVISAEDVAAAAALALDITLVINKAGIAQLGGFLADDSEDLARQIFSNQLLRNVDNEQFLRIHSQEQWWRQLTKCSIGRLMGEWGELAAYSANKSAARSLTNALRNELAGQKTQVMELHMAYNDTDLTRGFDVPKSSPAQIVQRALDSLKSGTDAVLADEITRQVKKGKGPRLPAIQGPYQQLGF